MKTSVAAFLVVSLALPVAGAPAAPADARIGAPTAIDSEASLDYFVSLAAKLVQNDAAASLRQLRKQLEVLLLEKKALLTKLSEAQRRASGAGAGDGGNAKPPRGEIEGLHASLARIEDEIQRILGEIGRVQSEERGRQDGAKAAAEALRRAVAALTQRPPRDPWVKALPPGARDAALAKALKSGGALVDVARNAGQAAADANAALADAADKQRKLLEEKEKLRAAQTKLDGTRVPSPTPTRTPPKPTGLSPQS